MIVQKLTTFLSDMAKPYPKPEKQEKKTPNGYWSNGVFIQTIGKKDKKPNKARSKTKEPQKYRTSSGELLSQTQIESRLSKAYKESRPLRECECCGEKPAIHHDHSVAQRICKIIKKAELIWNEHNWSNSCPECHTEWESYKSGRFQYHNNVVWRMSYLKHHAPEEYRKRLLYITRIDVLNELE